MAPHGENSVQVTFNPPKFYPHQIFMSNLLPLSFIAEFEYCPRSCFWKLTGHAPIGNENQFIADGNAAHEKVDEKYFRSKNAKRIESSVRVFSDECEISGVVDVVEFYENGVVPIEFKRGEMRENKMHETQLALATVCLREMFPTAKIDCAAIFFVGDKRRKEIFLTEEKIVAAKILAKKVSKLDLDPRNFLMQKDSRCTGCCFRDLCFV